jgi:hypothetical protein
MYTGGGKMYTDGGKMYTVGGKMYNGGGKMYTVPRIHKHLNFSFTVSALLKIFVRSRRDWEKKCRIGIRQYPTLFIEDKKVVTALK